MIKILTAEEYIEFKQKEIHSLLIKFKNEELTKEEVDNLFKNIKIWNSEEGIIDLMIKFAKLHVQAALEAASIKVKLSPDMYDFICDSWESGEWFDKDSILNAYNLDNIK